MHHLIVRHESISSRINDPQIGKMSPKLLARLGLARLGPVTVASAMGLSSLAGPDATAARSSAWSRATYSGCSCSLLVVGVRQNPLQTVSFPVLQSKTGNSSSRAARLKQRDPTAAAALHRGRHTDHFLSFRGRWSLLKYTDGANVFALSCQLAVFEKEQAAKTQLALRQSAHHRGAMG